MKDKDFRRYLAIPWKASELVLEDIDIEWLVDGLIPVGGRVLVAAQWKTGKSLFGAQLTLCLASGSPFLKYSIPKPAASTIIDLEIGPAYMVDRLRKMSQVYPDGLDKITVWMLKGKEGLTDALTYDKESMLVIVDPAIAMGYDNENDSVTIRRKLDEISGIVEGEIGAGLMVVHHVRKPSKEGFIGSMLNESRGSSAFVDWCDVGIGISKSGGEGSNRFKVETVNRGAPEEKPFYIARDSNTLVYHMEDNPAVVSQELIELAVFEWQTAAGSNLRPTQEEVVKRLGKRIGKGRTQILKEIKDIGGYRK